MVRGGIYLFVCFFASCFAADTEVILGLWFVL